MLEEAKAHNSKWGDDRPSSKMQAIKGLIRLCSRITGAAPGLEGGAHILLQDPWAEGIPTDE